jgi:RND family efflux transporter MFP subunit
MLDTALPHLTRGAGAALLALLLAGCGGQPQPAAPPPPTVSVSVPLQRQITDWDEYVGRFEAIEDVDVMPRVAGQITSIAFRPGVTVGRGAVLFTIDPRPFRATLERAQAQSSRAAATLANARSEAARARTLLGYNAVSREESQQKDAAVRTAAADLAAARASVNAAQLDLSFTTVRAPITGRVSDRRVSVGDNVAAGQTLLTRMVSVDPIWFTFDGAESLYLKYIREDREGGRRSSRYEPNPVEIQLADETGYRWRGRMTFVDNAIDPGSGTIRAHAVVANPDGFLVPGMFGRARLLGSTSYTALLIPPSAVVTDQTRKLVWVLGRDGKTVQRVVKLGPQVDGLAVVRDGLAPTDRVIIDNIGMLQPGMPVKPRRGVIRPTPPKPSDSTPVTAPPPGDATAR